MLKKHWLAVLVTLVLGVTASILGANANWPELGIIVAVAVMGGFIIHAIENK